MKWILLLGAGGMLFFTSCKKTIQEEEEEPPAPAPYVPAEDKELDLPRNFATADTLGQWRLVYDTDTDNSGNVTYGSDFHRVQFPTKDSGYISNTIPIDRAGYQFTKDGGKTWTKASIIPRTIIDIKFFTRDVGFFFNNSYPLQRLGEGGIYQLLKRPTINDTWYHKFISYLTNETRMVDISLANDTLAYAATTYGEFIRIKYPKSTSTIVNSEGTLSIDRDITAIAFVDANNGWIMTYDWSYYFYPKGTRVYRTSDGGKTWTMAYSTKDFKSNNLFALTTQKLWHTGGASIFKSTDGGSTWTKVHYKKADNTRFEPKKIVFLDDNRGFLLSLDEIYETKDGGATWQRSMRAVNIMDFTVTGRDHVWAIGRRKLYRLDL